MTFVYMATPATRADITLYPARYWGLDPLFWIHVKMFVKNVITLPQFQDYKGVHCLGNHPISRVEIMGYIVSVDIKERLTIYGVDDGTGTIPCCHWRPASVADEDRVQYEHGQLITVQGKISTFREQRQVTASLIYVERDVNCEVLFWLEVIHLQSTEYKKDFNLPHRLQETMESSSSLSKEEELTKSIQEYIKENNVVAFQFRNICSEPLIRECVRQVFLGQNNQSNKPPGSYEVQRIVRQSIKELERQGYLYYKDMQTDLYEVISHKHNLGAVILKAMKKLSNGSSGAAVSIRKLLDVIHSSHKFSYVTYHQVEESLNKFLESSDVYKQSRYEYCLV